MPEQATAEQVVDVSIGDPRFAAAVLERLVSAAAARAELPVDRVVNAMTVVDALVHAADSVLGDGPARASRDDRRTARSAYGSISSIDGQAEAIRDAAQLPDVGDVSRAHCFVASTIEHDGTRSALVIVLD